MHSFFRRFFEDPVFCAEYKAHWNTHYGDIAGIVSFIDAMAASLEKSQALNARRWGAVDYAQIISRMKTWWMQRMAYLDTEINKY
ncbi:hypothetical protein AGMMS49546_11630 [Spirochaetia bacterium]|nr:hypothetical protein AGMMS49546_11630 [Spirochaetia bacterium]